MLVLLPFYAKSHNVDAVLSAMRRLGFDSLLASRRCRERDLVVAMVVARILEPQSKLATSLWWSSTTLPELLDVSDADENELYGAMDWLLERQPRIERKLAARHLRNDGLALYDLSSSYFEGVTCPLASLGHNRDGKKGKLQVNYGLLTNDKGVPISVSVFKGNTGDPKTLLPQVEKVRKDFGVERFVLVGDRGMITQKQIDVLAQLDGVDWITALRSEAIASLANFGVLQLGLFDERNLFELSHPDFPNERLVACRNPELASRRARKRQSLLDATKKELEKVRAMVQRERLHGKDAISSRAHGILSKYKARKYYTLHIGESSFSFEIDDVALHADAERGAAGNTSKITKRIERSRQHMKKISKHFEKLQQRIGRGQLSGKDNIGVRVGKVINKYRVGKHFKLYIGESSFEFETDNSRINSESSLDGIYIIRTSLSAQKMSSEDTVRNYKQLSSVERAFRSFKTMDLKVRPIHHRLEDRVRAHILMCMLAYYVQWHMKEAWRPLLFSDEELDAKATRDPVAPAKRSKAALRKVHTRRLEDRTRTHSFRTLLSHLKTIVQNTCRRPGASPDEPTFKITTTPDAKQRQAYELIKSISL